MRKTSRILISAAIAAIVVSAAWYGLNRRAYNERRDELANTAHVYFEWATSIQVAAGEYVADLGSVDAIAVLPDGRIALLSNGSFAFYDESGTFLESTTVFEHSMQTHGPNIAATRDGSIIIAGTGSIGPQNAHTEDGAVDAETAAFIVICDSRGAVIENIVLNNHGACHPWDVKALESKRFVVAGTTDTHLAGIGNPTLGQDQKNLGMTTFLLEGDSTGQIHSVHYCEFGGRKDVDSLVLTDVSESDVWVVREATGGSSVSIWSPHLGLYHKLGVASGQVVPFGGSGSVFGGMFRGIATIEGTGRDPIKVYSSRRMDFDLLLSYLAAGDQPPWYVRVGPLGMGTSNGGTAFAKLGTDRVVGFASFYGNPLIESNRGTFEVADLDRRWIGRDYSTLALCVRTDGTVMWGEPIARGIDFIQNIVSVDNERFVIVGNALGPIDPVSSEEAFNPDRVRRNGGPFLAKIRVSND